MNMVDDNISDDTNEKSVVSDQEKGSRNKRKLGTPTEFPRYELLEEAQKGGTLFEIDPLKGGCHQCKEQEVEILPDVDWEDPITCQLLELLTQNLSTIFQSAVKRIAKCGYSEEIAERVILRSGLYHGSKDAVSNVVDGALALLSREKVFDIVFADLPSLVDYTLLEMVCVLREVKPDLPVVEAMWCLLIFDLNLVHACRVEGYPLVELCSQESPGDSSSALSLSQSKTEASESVGKDQAELKMFRQEKEDAEKVQQEMQMLERIMEMQKALVKTNSMIEKTNSRISTLERDSVGLKKDMEALMLSTSVYPLAKEQEQWQEKEEVGHCFFSRKK